MHLGFEKSTPLDGYALGEFRGKESHRVFSLSAGPQLGAILHLLLIPCAENVLRMAYPKQQGRSGVDLPCSLVLLLVKV